METLQNPRQLGFSMPPEWHPHSATWLAWPKDPETWPGRVEEVQQTFIEMIRHLSRGETVRLLVDSEDDRQSVLQQLRRHSIPERNIEVFLEPTADAWIRDYGPNFLIGRGSSSGKLAFNDWGFNAWGEKYPELLADSAVPGRLNQRLELTRFEPLMVLEGGSIDVNGQGSCLTTEQCLLNPNRNPSMGRGEIERRLFDFLGVDQIIWLGEGIEGDDTDGHVDDIVRFVSPDTILCAVEKDPADANYAPLQENLRRLRAARSADGTPFKVVELPMPERVEGQEGRLPASYANFYIGNQVVLAPVFGHRSDNLALEILRPLFPRRQVVGIRCEALVWGLGAIHCVTQQQPRVAAGR